MIRYATTRARYMGENQGMIMAAESNNPGISRSELINKLSKKSAKDLRRVYKDPESPHFISQLYATLSRAAALILSSSNAEAELIQLICHAPIISFSVLVVEMTIETVSWIMSSSPATVDRILGHLSQVWEQIALTKQGIYSAQDNILDPFEGPMTYGAPVKKPEQKLLCEPHKILINFFVERFKFDRLLHSGRLAHYSSFIMTACQPRFRFSSNFSSFQARLSLASLGIRIAKELSRRGDQAAIFVWTNVFRVSTGLFADAPTFGDLDRTDFKNLLSFYNSVKALNFEKISTMLPTVLLRSAFLAGPENERSIFL